MGKRKRQAKQASMWVATQDLPRSAAHPFYTRLIRSSTTWKRKRLRGGAPMLTLAAAAVVATPLGAMPGLSSGWAGPEVT